MDCIKLENNFKQEENDEVIDSAGNKLNTKVGFGSWKAFESLMNRRDKAEKEMYEARTKYYKLKEMTEKRAIYLGIKK